MSQAVAAVVQTFIWLYGLNCAVQNDELYVNGLDTAVGCADVIPPRNVWWKRSVVSANSTFGCVGNSLPVHRMTCVGNDWHSDTAPDRIDCPDSPLIG